MEFINIFLQQNDLKNKISAEQKKTLRKYLIKKRLEQKKIFGNTPIWGEEQFLKTLSKLNIMSSNELQNKYQIACFFPIQGELNFLPFAKSDWLMPKTIGNTLQWFEYGDGKTGYVKNQWGIPEKTKEHCFEYIPFNNKPLLCFVPGIAGDSTQHRLGYGRGYYDKFLAKHPNIVSVLCLPSEEFFFDTLPIENHDIKMSLIVY